MSSNPYQAPAADVAPADSSQDVAARIRVPSTGLIAMVILHAACYLAVGVAALWNEGRVDATPIELCLMLAHLLVMGVMLRSVLRIRRLTELRNGRIAAGIACIPFVTPFLWMGIPLGIWLSWILSRPSTALAFQTEQSTDG